MKKLFVALCSVLPGGFILLVTMLTFAACARLQYQDPSGNVRVSGYTTTPETAMFVSAEAEAVRAQAYATRKCSDDPRHCGAVGGAYGMDTPAGYTWAGINAVYGNPGTSGDPAKDLKEISKNTKETAIRMKGMVNSLEAFEKALSQKGKRR